MAKGNWREHLVRELFLNQLKCAIGGASIIRLNMVNEFKVSVGVLVGLAFFLFSGSSLPRLIL